MINKANGYYPYKINQRGPVNSVRKSISSVSDLTSERFSALS